MVTLSNTGRGKRHEKNNLGNTVLPGVNLKSGRENLSVVHYRKVKFQRNILKLLWCLQSPRHGSAHGKGKMTENM